MSLGRTHIDFIQLSRVSWCFPRGVRNPAFRQRSVDCLGFTHIRFTPVYGAAVTLRRKPKI
jgi:hypothetical protein